MAEDHNLIILHCIFVSIRNLVSHLTGGIQFEDVEKELFRGKFATKGRDDIETEYKRKCMFISCKEILLG